MSRSQRLRIVQGDIAAPSLHRARPCTPFFFLMVVAPPVPGCSLWRLHLNSLPPPRAAFFFACLLPAFPQTPVPMGTNSCCPNPHPEVLPPLGSARPGQRPSLVTAAATGLICPGTKPRPCPDAGAWAGGVGGAGGGHRPRGALRGHRELVLLLRAPARPQRGRHCGGRSVLRGAAVSGA